MSDSLSDETIICVDKPEDDAMDVDPTVDAFPCSQKSSSTHASDLLDAPEEDPGIPEHEAILNVLDALERNDLELGTFLYGLFHGNSVLRTNYRAVSTRQKFYQGDTFEKLLNHQYSPPRPKSKCRMATPGKATLDKFAFNLVEKAFDRELLTFGRSLSLIPPLDSAPDDPDSAISLMKQLSSHTHEHANKLTAMLSRISQPKSGGASRSKTESWVSDMSTHLINIGHICALFSAKVAISALCQLAFSRNVSYSAFQKHLAIFFKAKATPSKVMDLLNHFGLSMSFRWATSEIKEQGKNEMDRLTNYLKDGGRVCVIYDNIRIKFRKETQRVNNQTHGDNGTSISAIKLPKETYEILSTFRERDCAKQAELRSLPSYPRLTYADLIPP
jgi:hypothetical protein